MEQTGNILRELASWHRLHASCARCGRRAELQRRQLGRVKTVAEVEARLTCGVCLNRQGNRLTVTNAPR
jgi:hypothetical protein